MNKKKNENDLKKFTTRCKEEIYKKRTAAQKKKVQNAGREKRTAQRSVINSRFNPSLVISSSSSRSTFTLRNEKETGKRRNWRKEIQKCKKENRGIRKCA